MDLATEERDAIATICLMAAFADGRKNETERSRLKEIFESLDTEFSPALYSKVLLKQVDLAETAGNIQTDSLRQLAYEMAVGVCDADGATDDAEKAFLKSLGEALDIDQETRQSIDQKGEALASMPLNGDELALPAAVSANTDQHEQKEQPATDAGASTLDPMILKYAVLNGGLELLPQSLASMAIVPLQMKMVYRIGSHHGYQLDQGHIRELLATVGVGMTSQVLEGYARKLMGGFVKAALGKKRKTMAKAAGTVAGAAFSFASTYAIGQVAKMYYAGGRQMTTADLKQLFSRQVEEGKVLFDKYKGDVQNSAQNTDLNSILSMVRGGRVD